MSPPEYSPLSVVVLTYNEELNLPTCLNSLRPLECPIFVVDSGSTDRTLEIASLHGAHLATHAFETHSKQWQWALSNLPIGSEWVLAIDADQYLPFELAEEIRMVLAPDSPAPIPAGTNGVYLNRRYIFRGTWLRHGGLYPKLLLKLFRKRHVRMDELDLLDHHFYVAGDTTTLSHDLIEHNRKEDDIAFWSQKHIGYAAKLAQEEVARRRDRTQRPLKSRFFGTPDEHIVALKSIWGTMPPYVRPFMYFFYRYVVRLGWLDGKQGLVFHTLQALWFRLLVDISVDQLIAAELGSGDKAVYSRTAKEHEND